MEASSVLSPTDRGCALICKRFVGVYVCVCLCLCVCLFPSVFITSGKVAWRVFPQEWRERCHPALSSSPHLTWWHGPYRCISYGQFVLLLCLRISRCCCTYRETPNTNLGAFRHRLGIDLFFCEEFVLRVKWLFHLNVRELSLGLPSVHEIIILVRQL